MIQRPGHDVAIVGMACIFPGAGDLETYWKNIAEGKDAITAVPPSRWDKVFHDPSSDAVHRLYTDRGGFIDELGSVDGATTETVSIPIEIDFLDAGVALYSVLQGEKLEVDFQADMDVDTPFGVVPLQVDQLAEIGIER